MTEYIIKQQQVGNMLKQFTLNKREEEKISETHGKMSFFITDENGNDRVVTGTTFLNEDQVAQGISSKNKRELPLIEGLFRLEIGEVIDVEFESYNKVYYRDLDKTVNQLAYDTVLEMEKEKNFFYRIAKVFKRQVLAESS